MQLHELTRLDFKWFFQLQTRWSDNDMYGHINNAMYHCYLDTVMSEFLIHTCQFDIQQHDVMSVVVSNQCDYFKSVAYPAQLHIGLCVEHIGTKSIRYRIGFFKDDQMVVSAVAKLTEVWVDKISGASVHIPKLLLESLKQFQD